MNLSDPHRRNIVKGAAWTGPAIVAASGAPGLAASVICDDPPAISPTNFSNPIIVGSYRRLGDSAGSSTPQGWRPNSYHRNARNNASRRTATTYATRATLTLEPGETYTITVPFSSVNDRTTPPSTPPEPQSFSRETRFNVLIDDVSQFQGTTQSGLMLAGPLGAPRTGNIVFTYTATTASVVLAYQWTMVPLAFPRYVNDDLSVHTPTIACA